MIDRMLRAARLDAHLYEEVEHDTSATGQAMMVVVITSLAAGIGTITATGIWGLVAGVLGGLLGWVILSGLTYFIGVTLLKTPHTDATWGQLLRTIGFAQSPGMLAVFGFIPWIGAVILFGTGVWVLVAVVIAVRQALDYTSTIRAVLVTLAGWAVLFVLSRVVPNLLL